MDVWERSSPLGRLIIVAVTIWIVWAAISAGLDDNGGCPDGYHVEWRGYGQYAEPDCVRN